MLYSPFVTDNRIINGDFLIDQPSEFTASTPSATGYFSDLFKFETTGLGSGFTFQLQSAVAPSNFKNSLKALTAVATTPSAAQYAVMSQPIEGINVTDLFFGATNARSIVISFFAYALVAGTYYLSVRNGASSRSYVTPFVIGASNSWQAFSIFIPGDNSGTWNNTEGTIGMIISFDLGSGSNFQTTPNTWTTGTFTSSAGATSVSTTIGNTLYIGNLVLRQGPLTDAGPYYPRPYYLEKLLCLRYYRKSFPLGTVPAQNAGVSNSLTIKNPIATGAPSIYVPFNPPMAISPTITTFNPSAANANWRDTTSAADVGVSVDPSTTKGTNGVLIATSATVTAQNDILSIHYVADSRI